MGLLNKATKAAIRRGAWCNTANAPIPEHVKAAAKLPVERASVLYRVPAPWDRSNGS